VLEKHRKKLGIAFDVIQFQNCCYVGSHTLYRYCRVHVKLQVLCYSGTSPPAITVIPLGLNRSCPKDVRKAIHWISHIKIVWTVKSTAGLLMEFH